MHKWKMAYVYSILLTCWNLFSTTICLIGISYITSSHKLQSALLPLIIHFSSAQVEDDESDNYHKDPDYIPDGGGDDDDNEDNNKDCVSVDSVYNLIFLFDHFCKDICPCTTLFFSDSFFSSAKVKADESDDDHEDQDYVPEDDQKDPDYVPDDLDDLN
ncbi:unnamed protein product, partial [Owenia fusiformis]